MTWEISHSADAWEQARENLNRWTRRDLMAALAYNDFLQEEELVTSTEIAAFEAERLDYYRGIPFQDLIDRCIAVIESHNSCTNGGHEFYISEDGHWTVSVRPRGPRADFVTHTVTAPDDTPLIEAERKAAATLDTWGVNMFYLSGNTYGQQARLAPEFFGHFALFQEGDRVYAGVGGFATADAALRFVQRMLGEQTFSWLDAPVLIEKAIKQQVQEGALRAIDEIESAPRLV